MLLLVSCRCDRDSSADVPPFPTCTGQLISWLVRQVLFICMQDDFGHVRVINIVVCRYVDAEVPAGPEADVEAVCMNVPAGPEAGAEVDVVL